MKKVSIILLIVLAIALYPNMNNEESFSVKNPITTFDLPHTH